MSEPPTLRVVRGQPTDDELAALTAVLLARARDEARAEDDAPTRSPWSREAGIRRPLPHAGSDAWRASLRRR
ncbi:MAG TPA: acyl-CoA carboxylase epsilon subunit [Mycobacteriales bacterium]|nr:acyl-CoA carboxylase epsilon subunit [Mycobacteriales bacterium]